MSTPRCCAATLLCLALAACGGGGEGGPESDDDDGGRPATELPASLAAELGCGACHAGMPPPDLVRRRAPRLGAEGRRPPASFLFRYLRDPVAQRSDIGRSRMPDFHLDTAEAAALTLFLLEEQGTPLAEGEGPPALDGVRARDAVDAGRGERIFRALNCAGCHRGIDVEPWVNGPPLGGESRRARAGWLRRWLLRPLAVRPFGYRPGTGSRMPDYRLTRAEADTLVDALTPGAGASDAVGGGDGADAGSAASPPGEADGPLPLSPYEVAKADALLGRRLPCLGCHELGGRGGRVGPALDRVAARRPADYVLGMIREPGAHAPGTVMPPVPMPDGRAELLARRLLGSTAGDGVAPRDARETSDPPRRGYLSMVAHPVRAPEEHEMDAGGRPAGTRDPTPAARDGRPDRPAGAALYRSTCAACHGLRGSGNGYNARYLPVRPTPHASAEVMAPRPDATLFDGIHAGGRILGRSHFMPPFGARLERELIWSLVRHVRELCDCREPEWARDGRPAPEGP